MKNPMRSRVNLQYLPKYIDQLNVWNQNQILFMIMNFYDRNVNGGGGDSS